MTTRAWAHAIVRRYPRAWRERYEAEVRALIDDTPVPFRELGVLLRGLLSERARELLTSDDRPGRTAILLGFVMPLTGVILIALAWLAGYSAHLMAGPLSETVGYVILAIWILLLLTSLFVWWRGWTRRTLDTPPALPADTAVVLLVLLFVEVALLELMAYDEARSSLLIPYWLNTASRLMFWGVTAGSLLSCLFPGQALLQEFAHFSYAEGRIRANEIWVQGCHDMIAKGVPSPLGDALAQVEKWKVERDSARARMKALGYRARFRVDPPPGSDPRLTPV